MNGMDFIPDGTLDIERAWSSAGSAATLDVRTTEEVFDSGSYGFPLGGSASDHLKAKLKGRGWDVPCCDSCAAGGGCDGDCHGSCGCRDATGGADQVEWNGDQGCEAGGFESLQPGMVGADNAAGRGWSESFGDVSTIGVELPVVCEGCEAVEAKAHFRPVGGNSLGCVVVKNSDFSRATPANPGVCVPSKGTGKCVPEKGCNFRIVARFDLQCAKRGMVCHPWERKGYSVGDLKKSPAKQRRMTQRFCPEGWYVQGDTVFCCRGVGGKAARFSFNAHGGEVKACGLAEPIMGEPLRVYVLTKKPAKFGDKIRLKELVGHVLVMGKCKECRVKKAAKGVE